MAAAWTSGSSTTTTSARRRRSTTAWQCALIAARPDLVARVQPAIGEMLRRVDFAKVNHGWTYNYAVLAALWSLAAAPAAG